MTVYIVHDGELVEARRAPPVPRLAIHGDRMDPTMHPVTGETMDSKSAFRRVTKENGCVELGTDAWSHFARPREPFRDPQLRADLRESMKMIEQGYRPPPIEAVPELDSLDTRIYSDE